MKKKIMFIDKNKIVNYSGGVERVICNFANEFIDRGYDVTIVCIDTENGQPFFPLKSEVKFVNLCYSYSNKPYNSTEYSLKKIQREVMRGLLGKKLSLFGHRFSDPREQYFYDEFSLRLEKCLLDISPDIILPTDVESTKVVVDVLERLKFHIPVISMCHSDPEWLTYTPEYVEALKKADVVQVLLPAFKDFFLDMGIESVVDIPNVVVQCSDDEIRDLANSNNRIITVGRLDGAGKRQHLLLEAFAAVADDFPDWAIDVYGDVANKRYKKRLDEIIISHGLQDRVNFAGTTKNILAEYKKADIFAFPTEYEGFSLAMTEAMTAGLPVLVYKECRSAAEVAGECGIACENGVEPYRAGLVKLMSDIKLRIELGRAGHERVKRYAADVVWNKWEELIKACI